MATKIWVGTTDDWNVAGNWSPAGVPVNADDVYIENSTQDIASTLDQSAVTLDSLNIAQSFTGKIGTTSAYLQIGATIVRIGYHYGPASPAGSGRLKIDLGAAAAAVTVYNTGSTPTETNKPCVRLLANHANTTIEVRKGKVGIAFDTGETTTIASCTVSYVSHKNTDAEVIIGSGVTLTTFEQTGGDNILQCAATTANAEGGSLLTAGSGAITTLNAKDGDVISNSTGTITTLTITGSNVDLTKSAAARTVTNCTLDEPGSLKVDPGVVTFTNKILSANPVIWRASAA